MCADPQGMYSDTVSRQTDVLLEQVCGCQECRVRVHRHTLSSVHRREHSVIEPFRPWLPAPAAPTSEGLGAGIL